MAKRPRQQARKGMSKAPKGVAIYHDMKVYENFERCAQRIFECVRMAQQQSPGAPRTLFLDIQGHRNSLGGYDADALELMKEFGVGFLLQFLTELSTPLIRVRNNGRQRDDLPDVLTIDYPDDGSEYGYDAAKLGLRPREKNPADRRSKPTLKAITAYLGMDEPACLVCWGTKVERAHVVPDKLGGSLDVRNFALLCPTHHAEAPDVADAESFWAWVDYAELRDSPDKWRDAPEELQEWLRERGVRIGSPPREEQSFFSAVKRELKSLYGWGDDDFGSVAWEELMEEFHAVLDSATGRHFAVEKKVSTYAWAYDVARRRVAGEAGPGQGVAARLPTP
ncbi:HNH endonuclease [Streptomyces sp. NBC_01077]|uniref:HNH endonuclease signature motif containing protein n=1 Tax=Streptomyces sp. NBC_01077 TaxID=2903746 RepID=UPI00386E455F|nr:HNH endonuclease [Streptomyces sp. NBC_01077]